MAQLPHGKLTMGLGVLSVVGLILLLGGATNVSAQFGRGSQLEPEQLQAAWILAARGVAHELDLSKENTSKLVDAYIAAREGYQTAMPGMMGGGMPSGEMMGGGAPPGGGMQGGGMPGGSRGFGGGGFQEIAAAERDSLETVLKGFLSDEQVAKAIESLGTFNSEWDTMLDIIAGFDLDDEVLFKVLALINTYVVESTEAVSEAMANQDFQSMRTVRQTHKATLDAGLSEILPVSQFVSWTTATMQRMQGGARGQF